MLISADRADTLEREKNVFKKADKSKESWPKGPGFGYPRRGFALMEAQIVEITRIKLQRSNTLQ